MHELADHEPILALIARMEAMERRMVDQGDARRYFHSTYLRTTRAVAAAIDEGHFMDASWVARWDVRFAELYLDAVDAADAAASTAAAGGLAVIAGPGRLGPVPGPWRAAFAAARDPSTPPLRLTLLGMNAHINFDLAQALVAVISPEEFDDPAVRAQRAEDHRRIDAVLASRVRAENRELQRVEPPGSRTWLDRALTPLNTVAAKRFLGESRRKVWHNAAVLDAARRRGPLAYQGALDLLAERAEARVADLARPGQVLLRLARHGFGVELPATLGVDDDMVAVAARP